MKLEYKVVSTFAFNFNLRRYNPGQSWTGMKTVGMLRWEKKMAIPVNPDSIYKPIERPTRVFNKLQVGSLAS